MPPVLSIASTAATMNSVTMTNGNIVISTDIVLPSPPATYTITLQVTGFTPGVDFDIFGFTWVDHTTYWTGTRDIDYLDLSPTNPITFAVLVKNNSQYNTVNGNFEIVATADYNVDAVNYNVDMFINGNGTNIKLLPPKVTFDTSLDVDVKEGSINKIYNVSGNTYYVTDIRIPEDTGGIAGIYVQSGGEIHLGTWKKWGVGISTKTIVSGGSFRFVVLLESSTVLDISEWTVELDISDGGSPPYTETYKFAFQPVQAVAAISACSSQIDVQYGSFTWIDGTIKPAVSSPGCPDYDAGSACGCSSGVTALIPVEITNLGKSICTDGVLDEQIRLGDLVNGWYPSLLDDDNGNAVIVFPAVASDSDYVLLGKGDSKTIYVQVTCDNTEGSHQFILDAMMRKCQRAVDTLSVSLSNGNVSVVCGDKDQTSSSAGGTTFYPINLTDYVQGYDVLTALSNENISYVYPAKMAGPTIIATDCFKAPADGDYTFTVQASFLDEPAATERDFSVYVNGAWNQMLTEIKTNHSIDTEFTLTLSTGDTVAFSAYSDQSIGLYEYFSVIVRLQEKSDFPAVCLGCESTFEWSIVQSNLVVLPASIVISETEGGSYTSYVDVRNDGLYAETITGCSIGGTSDLINVVTSYPVTIAPGGTQRFWFTYSPTTAYSAIPITVTFTKSLCASLVITGTVESVAATIRCQIAPSQNIYDISVTQNIQSNYINLIEIIPQSNYGDLVIDNTSGCSGVTFAGGSQIFIQHVSPGVSFYVPISVLITSCPGADILCSMPCTFYDYYDKTKTCSFNINLRIKVECSTQTSCPAQFSPTVVSISGLHESDTGSFTSRLLLSDTVEVLGLSVVDFEIPPTETILAFGTLTNIPGKLTWSSISTTKKRATLVIPANDLEWIDVELDYSIPTGGSSSYIHSSSLTAKSTFASSEYSCNDIIEPIYLGVEVAQTTGGYETKDSVTEVDDCVTIQINDTSLYADAVANHLISNFTLYRRIVITKPDGTTYVMSTHGSYDELIEPAYNSGSPIYAYNYDVSELGGVYQISLCSVPTYNSSGTWLVGDCCCVGDSSSVRFFEALQVNTNIIPLSTPGWESYWAEITEDELQEPYCATTYYVQDCALQECMDDMASNVFCSFDNICKKSMCEDECQMRYFKLMILMSLINKAIADADYDALTEYYNGATALCGCQPCS